MKVAFFDTHTYEREIFDLINKEFHHVIVYFEPKLNATTASLAKGARAVCCFVNDKINREALAILKQNGCRLIALRSAGFNQVDLRAAAEFNIEVVRVPEYSPYAVAEHVVALIQTLNRKTHHAFNRVREGNFALNGLVGFDLHGKTIGVLGAGKIGKVLARIMKGFGCEVLLYDLVRDEKLEKELGCRFATLDEIARKSDIISLHLPLTKDTHHCIDASAFASMKKGVMIINTGRGGLIDSRALIQALKSGQVGSAGLDVYEEEEGVFFQDFSGQIISDDVLARLLTFPNVVITGHQAFLTREALQNIAHTTLENISAFENNRPLVNEVREQ